MLRGVSKTGKVLISTVVGLFAILVVSAFASTGPTNEVPLQTPTSATQQSSDKSEVKQASVEVKTEVQTEPIAFQKTTINDSGLTAGKTVLRTAGVNGERKITFEVTYSDGTETARKKISEEVAKAPVNEVTAVGTKVAAAPKPVQSNPKPTSNCDPNYTPCIPNTSGNALNCPDIGIAVHVIGVDHNKLDADGDGIGCDSYQ